MEIAQTCAIGMIRIQHELQSLAQQYPPLSDIGSVKIEKTSLYSGNNNLSYWKNAHIEMAHYDAGVPVSQMRESAGKLIIDKGGIVLEIAIQNVDDLPSARVGGVIYPLLLTGGKARLRLVYNLQLNSSDLPLEEATKDIIEKNVGLLRKQLQDILGVNPSAERSQACVPVMTNILSGLQALAQQYPILSNIGSATIETKGTNYLYQHLKFWNKAHVVDTNDFKPFQGHPLIGSTKVEKGGIALDIYLRKSDEPFGFDPDNTDTLVSDDRKIQLQYILFFNPYERFNDSGQVKATDKAVRDVIESQRDILRKKLSDIIDF